MPKGNLSIGWSSTEITPPKKTLLVGQFHARFASSAISPLTATALALETRPPDGPLGQAIFLSCDLLWDNFKPDLVEKLRGRCPGLDLTQLTVNCTHTHSAPPVRSGFYPEPAHDPEFMTPDEYRAFLVERLADVVESAWTARRPGSIRRGFGYAVVGRCRRSVYPGGAKMYGSTAQKDFLGLEACDDHAVNFLFTQNESGALSGLIINLACTSQCDEGSTKFSADFWHNVREGLQQQYGASIHLLPQCAPAGDASPHLMLDQREEKDLRDRLKLDDKGIIARRILAAAKDALETASPPEREVELCHEVRVLNLPRLRVTAEEYEMEKRMRSLTEEERKALPWMFQRHWPFGPICDLVTRYEEQGEHPRHRIEHHLVRLGDVVFATNPFELYLDYGARIRARSKALQTFLVQLADGSVHGFYLPTRRAVEGGSYSAVIKSNWVGPEGGDLLVEETVSGINRLFADENYPTTR